MGQYLLFFYGWLVNFKGASLPPHVFISGTALTILNIKCLINFVDKNIVVFIFIVDFQEKTSTPYNGSVQYHPKYVTGTRRNFFSHQNIFPSQCTCSIKRQGVSV